MRRKFINGVRYLNNWVIQSFKRTYIRLLFSNILIDDKTFIGRGVTIKALKGAKIDIRGVYIKDYAYLYADQNARIFIGANAQVGMHNVVVAKKEIIIGSGTLMAEFVSIRDQDHDINDLNRFNIASIYIGTGVWLASKVTVTKGVCIGNGAVVGANSVVTRNIEEKSLAVGAPAKVIKKIL